MTTNVIFSQITLLVRMSGNKKKTCKDTPMTKQRQINLDTKCKSRRTRQNSDTLMLEDRNKVWKTNTQPENVKF